MTSALAPPARGTYPLVRTWQSPPRAPDLSAWFCLPRFCSRYSWAIGSQAPWPLSL